MRRIWELLWSLRILGWWAPIWLTYQIAKRTGLIGSLLSSPTRQHISELRDPIQPPIEIPKEADKWTLGEAEAIREGHVGLFGREVHTGNPPDWFQIVEGGPSWPRLPWWKIDLYSDSNRDVRWIWELGRHRHLVVLANALSLNPEDRDNAETLNLQLRSWFQANPPGLGVHWTSSLEIGLRALAWLRVWGTASSHLESDVTQHMGRHLRYSGKHIVANLPLTLSSMRNNHLIGEAVALVAVGKTLDRAAWAKLGDRILRWHLPRHLHRDGSTIEDSVGYRCFILELLTVRILIGDAPREVSDSARRLGEHLRRMGVGSGDVPHCGDWDGGHILAGETPDLEPGRSLARYEETLLSESPAATSVVSPVSDGSDVGGELGRISVGPWTAWLKCAAEESHGHSDLLSVSILHNGACVVGDPGNGSYNRSMEERNYFRTAIAHSVVRVEGHDQRVPHRRFRWRYQPTGRLGRPFDAGPYRVMWGTHDAYQRLPRPQDCMRACLVSNTAFVVIDWVIGEPTDYAMSLPLHPDVEWSDGRLEIDDSAAIGVKLPGQVSCVRGSHQPYDGWWADTYDSVRPATRLEITGTTDQAIVWALFTEAEQSYEVKGDQVSVGDLTFKPERRDDRLVLLSD